LLPNEVRMLRQTREKKRDPRAEGKKQGYEGREKMKRRKPTIRGAKTWTTRLSRGWGRYDHRTA